MTEHLDIEHITNARVVVLQETDEGVRFNISTVMTITGNDRMQYRGLRLPKVRELKIITAELPVYYGQIFNDSCMVCWNKTDMLILSCGHVLCQPCLILCYDNYYPCGLCKTPITSDGIFNKPILSEIFQDNL